MKIIICGSISAALEIIEIKNDLERGKSMIGYLVQQLYTIARMLNPLLPETNIKLKALIKANKKPEQPLFLRKD